MSTGAADIGCDLVLMIRLCAPPTVGKVTEVSSLQPGANFFSQAFL